MKKRNNTNKFNSGMLIGCQWIYPNGYWKYLQLIITNMNRLISFDGFITKVENDTLTVLNAKNKVMNNLEGWIVYWIDVRTIAKRIHIKQ